MESISWTGVLLGAVALFVLGAIWYSVLFAKVYRQELGVPEPVAGDPGPDLGKALATQFIAGLVISVTLAWLIGDAGVNRGIGIGVAGGVLVAGALGQFHAFEGRTIRHLLLHVGYMIIGLGGVGAILGAFQG